MQLNHRLLRLEKDIDVQECKTCHGTGRAKVILVNEGEKPDVSESMCPDCGIYSPFLKIITLVSDGRVDI